MKTNQQVPRGAPDKPKVNDACVQDFNSAPYFKINPADIHACRISYEMWRIFNEIEKSIPPDVAPDKISPMLAILNTSQIKNNDGAVLGSTEALYVSYLNAVNDLRNEQLDTYNICSRAQLVNAMLSPFSFTTYFAELQTVQAEIDRLKALVEDLTNLAEAANSDANVTKEILQCNRFNCANEFKQYAQALRNRLESGYEFKLKQLRTKGLEMENMFQLTEEMKLKESLFARTFVIEKRAKHRKVTVSVERERLGLKPPEH